MRVVVAPDSFGGSLSAVQAADALAAGWRRGAPHDEVITLAVSDGGPGFVDVLARCLPGELLLRTVTGPRGEPVPAAVLLTPDGVAYVESAMACGLHLVPVQERDPGLSTTRGVGELIVAALDAGARRIVVGLGGSATNDGGAGALEALGARLLGPAGATVLPGGAALGELVRIDVAGVDPRLRGVDLVVATDVDNPLLGPAGASAVYGPQKGADASSVQRLDLALTVWAERLVADLGARTGLASEPGAGAAGGLGAALFAVGGVREPGIATVLRLLGLDRALLEADLVVTGEGSYDWQSLRGKVVSGVAGAAAELGLPCLVLAGQVSVGRRESAAAGVEAAYSLAEHLGSVDAAQRRPERGLALLAEQVAREWSRAR